MMVQVAPSLLSADFARLGAEVKKITTAGADLVHLDVMDGHFVPNLTFGPAVIKSIRSYTALPFDVHLMMTNPLAFIKHFAEAGANMITAHIEAEDEPTDIIDAIKKTRTMREAAKLLGCDNSSVSRKVKKYGLDPDAIRRQQ